MSDQRGSRHYCDKGCCNLDQDTCRGSRKRGGHTPKEPSQRGHGSQKIKPRPNIKQHDREQLCRGLNGQHWACSLRYRNRFQWSSVASGTKSGVQFNAKWHLHRHFFLPTSPGPATFKRTSYALPSSLNFPLYACLLTLVTHCYMRLTSPNELSAAIAGTCNYFITVWNSLEVERLVRGT